MTVGSYRLLDEVSGAVAGNYVKRHTAFSVRLRASEADLVARVAVYPPSICPEGGRNNTEIWQRILRRRNLNVVVVGGLRLSGLGSARSVVSGIRLKRRWFGLGALVR